jgi:hypothetical protein
MYSVKGCGLTRFLALSPTGPDKLPRLYVIRAFYSGTIKFSIDELELATTRSFHK